MNDEVSNNLVWNRRAVRAILLTADHQVLLIQSREPQSGRALWLLPGGGIEAGESAADGLGRELQEETGLRDFELGPHVWVRQHTFSWDGTTICQHEDYYLIQAKKFQPTMAANPEQAEIDSFSQFRWWTVEAIMHSDEFFVPQALGQSLYKLVYQGAPEEPFDVGV